MTHVVAPATTAPVRAVQPLANPVGLLLCWGPLLFGTGAPVWEPPTETQAEPDL